MQRASCIVVRHAVLLTSWSGKQRCRGEVTWLDARSASPATQLKASRSASASDCSTAVSSRGRHNAEEG